MEIPEREQTSWNLSEYKINLVGQLMQQASYHALRGNHTRVFDCWRQIALAISNRLEPKEKRKLIVLEKQAYTKGRRYIPYEKNPNLLDNERIIPNGKFEYYIRQYAEYVNYLLKELGMDIKTRDFDDELID